MADTTSRSSIPSHAIDTTVPSVARAYDAALGGKDNYEVDRKLLAQQAIRLRFLLRQAGFFDARRARISRHDIAISGIVETPVAERSQRFIRDARLRAASGRLGL